VYVDRSNVSQTDWLEYVAWRNKWDSTFVMSPLDSAVRRQIYTKALRDTPVTGLTREQADGYCLWRTKMVNEHSRFAKAKKEVCYTLPAEAQCQLLSQKRKWRKHNIESDPFPTKGFRCIAVMSKRK
jgi:formylglycine-generating enzyme required for sulfatase activity